MSTHPTTPGEFFYQRNGIAGPGQRPTIEAMLDLHGITGVEWQRLDLATGQPIQPLPLPQVDLREPDPDAEERTRALIQTEMGIINRILHEHKIKAGVDKTRTLVAGSSYIIYGLKLKEGGRITTIESRLRELSEAISANRGQPTQARLRELPLGLEVPHPFIQPLPLGLAYDYRGESEERVDLRSTAHLLIAGTTGSGKSTALASGLIGLAYNTPPSKLQMILIDLKNEDLVPFADLPHVRDVANSMGGAEHVLNYVFREKEERVEAGRGQFQRLVLVVDELAEIGQIKDALKRLGSILSIGRSKKINVIAATQHPTSEVIGSIAKANFPCRVVGKVLSSDNSRTATGRSGLHAELLPGQGSFLRVEGVQERRFQGYYVDASGIDDWVNAINQRWPQKLF